MRPSDRLVLVLIAIVLALLFWGGYVCFVRFRLKKVAEDLRKRADVLVEEIAAEFPEEVGSWGGRAVLRHPLTVRQIQQEFDPPVASVRTSGPGPEDIATDPTRRTLLVARTARARQVVEGHE